MNAYTSGWCLTFTIYASSCVDLGPDSNMSDSTRGHYEMCDFWCTGGVPEHRALFTSLLSRMPRLFRGLMGVLLQDQMRLRYSASDSKCYVAPLIYINQIQVFRQEFNVLHWPCN